MEAYTQSQGFDVWEKVSNAYVIPNQINNTNKAADEANCKACNLIINGVGRSDFDRIVILKLCMRCEILYVIITKLVAQSRKCTKMFINKNI